MTRKASVLAPVLRSETQARLLAAVLLQPDREASIADLARETGSDPGNLHSEVERLVQAGILADRRVGRTRLLHAGDSALLVSHVLERLLSAENTFTVIVPRTAEQAMQLETELSTAALVETRASM